jgi:hypothetical protein
MTDSILTIEFKVNDNGSVNTVKGIVNDHLSRDSNKLHNSSINGSLLKLEVQNITNTNTAIVADILTALKKFSTENPFASIWHDNTDETLYYAITNNELVEYASAEEAKSAAFEVPTHTSHALSQNLRQNLSLIKIGTQNKAHNALVTQLTELVKPESAEQNFSLNIADNWAGNFSTITPAVASVTDKGTYIVIGLNLKQTELFPLIDEDGDCDAVDLSMEAASELAAEIYNWEHVDSVELILRTKYQRGNKCVYANYVDDDMDYGGDNIAPDNGWF